MPWDAYDSKKFPKSAGAGGTIKSQQSNSISPVKEPTMAKPATLATPFTSGKIKGMTQPPTGPSKSGGKKMSGGKMPGGK